MKSTPNEAQVVSTTAPDASVASGSKQVWHAPQLISHGEVVEMTQGISLNPSDGFSNLTV